MLKFTQNIAATLVALLIVATSMVHLITVPPAEAAMAVTTLQLA